MKMSNTTKQMAALAAGLLTTGLIASADQAMPAGGPERSYSGQVVSVDPQERTFSVKSWLLSSRQFNLGANCTFLMVGQGNDTAADLRPGQEVTVSYQVAQGVRVADRIQQRALRYEGAVAAIDQNAHSVTLHQRGFDRRIEIAPGCTVMLKNDKAGTLADIQPGDHVTITYETPNGMPVAREISQTSAEFVGRLTALDLEAKTVKAKDTFGTMKFNLADNCAIVINGKTDGTLSELRPDERLVFNYEQLNGVNVVNRIAPAPAQSQANSTLTPYPGSPAGY
jgi:Cu/Ag efflux protein CusF